MRVSLGFCSSQSILLSTTITEPSKLDTLSESVMNKDALNDDGIIGQLIYSTGNIIPHIRVKKDNLYTLYR